MKKSVFLNTILCVTVLYNTSVLAQSPRLLIGDNNNGQIIISKTDGSELDTIDLGGLYQSFYDADVDPVNQKIYMAWYYGIYSMNYDGTDFDTLVWFPSGGYTQGISVDPTNGLLYWCGTPLGEIYRADLDLINIDTIHITTGYLGDIDLDLLTNKLYFTQWITSEKGVFVMDADGSNLDTIAYGYDANFLGLDMANEVIYFGDGTTTRRINYNQTLDALMFSFQCGGFIVDTLNSKLYTTSVGTNNVQVSNLDGSGAMDLFPPGTVDAPFGPVLFPYSLADIETVHADNLKISLFPNPASHQLTISGVNQPFTLVIYNAIGEQVLMHTLTGESQIDISNLSPGTYTVVAESMGIRSNVSVFIKN